MDLPSTDALDFSAGRLLKLPPFSKLSKPPAKSGISRAPLCVLLLFLAQPASATIRYTISLDHPEQHIFHVHMEIPHTSNGTRVAMPAWNALYQIRDFAYRVNDLRISNQELGGSAAIQPLDKQTWQIDVSAAGTQTTDNANIAMEYSVQWNERGPFNSQLDSHHAFMNFAELLMYIPDRRGEDTQITFENVPPDWKIAAELSAADTPNSFSAPSYDALVDAPAEASKFDEFAFDNRDTHFRVVVDGTNWNRGHLEEYLRRITGYELNLMGGAPFPHYTFFFHIGPDSDANGGGMEHSFSTAIATSSTESAAYIAAHEFFHVWNVKRIRPQALEPVDYTREQYTRDLWFAEGVTSTYGTFALERAGLWTKDQFYADLAGRISELESRPARKTQSVEQSSLDTWLEKYDAYNRPERSISYYNKGQILGDLLDLSIRDATDNHHSLDDVLRRMNAEFAQQGRFYNETTDIRAVVEEITGTSYEDFFRRYISGTDDVPYGKFLAAAGLQLTASSGKNAALGFTPAISGSVAKVSAVQAGGAADIAGLQNGDVILSVNDSWDAKTFAKLLRDDAAGDTIKLRISRNGQESEVPVTVPSRKDQRFAISEIQQPTEKQLRIREGFLRGTTD